MWMDKGPEAYNIIFILENEPVLCKNEDVEGSRVLKWDPSSDGAWGWEEEACSPGLQLFQEVGMLMCQRGL